MKELAVAFVTTLIVFVPLWWSPPLECSRRPGYVYVVDERACLPIMAFTPAR